MSTLLPDEHLSAAVAVVYFMCKQTITDYSIDQWNFKANEGVDPSDWIKIIGDDDEQPFPFIFPCEAKPGSAPYREGQTTDYTRVTLTFLRSVGNSIMHDTVFVYPPYTEIVDNLGYFSDDRRKIKFPWEYSETWRFALFFRKLLRSGRLKSYVSTQTGKLLAVPESFWLSNQANEVLKHDVSTLVHYEQGDIFGRISLVISDIEAYFQAPKKSENDNTKDVRSRDEADDLPTTETILGRPTKFDAEAFLMEAMKIVLDGAPETQSELSKRAAAAYVTAGHKGGAPSPEWAKKKISILWKALNLRGG